MSKKLMYVNLISTLVNPLFDVTRCGSVSRRRRIDDNIVKSISNNVYQLILSIARLDHVLIKSITFKALRRTFGSALRRVLVWIPRHRYVCVCVPDGVSSVCVESSCADESFAKCPSAQWRSSSPKAVASTGTGLSLSRRQQRVGQRASVAGVGY